MHRVTKELKWCMAHRLVDEYPDNCKYLHGHNYKAVATFQAVKLDEYGMVIDFTTIKKRCQGWIDDELDHTTMVCTRDPSLLRWLMDNSQPHVLVDINSTAENIAKFLLNKFQALINQGGRGILVTSVKVWETPTAYAEWRAD